MKKSKVTALILCICMVFGQTVYAQNGTGKETLEEGSVQIVRKAAGDMEALMARKVSDEETRGWMQEEENHLAGKLVQNGQMEKEFLECGSDYGYQDMEKRSHSANRQYLYRKIEEECKAFTLNKTDAVKTDMEGEVFYRAATIDLSGYPMTDDEKIETYFMFRNDNPQFFWLSNWTIWSDNSLVVLTYGDYSAGTERQKAFNEILQTQETLYKSQISSFDTAYRKVSKIHDTLIADITYAEDVNKENTHSIAGAMTMQKSAVCEGYSKVMQLMMNCYGIENIYVTGNAGGAHAWNMVQMEDGKYYWLDATWDDQSDEESRRDYFLVGNNNFTNHIPDTSELSGVNFLYSLPGASDIDYEYIEIPLQSIQIEEAVALSEGETRTLTVSYFPEDTTEDKSVTWTSSDDSVVSVNKDGVIKGERAGQAVVTAKIGALQEKCVVTVSELLQNRKKGDVNQDDKVNIEDLRMVLRAVCGKLEFTQQQKEIADVVEDGKVDIQDLRKTLRFVCGKIEKL